MRAIEDFARSRGLAPNMIARIPGEQPLWMGADPNGGWIYLLRVDAAGVQILASWTAVQGEELKIAHDRAMYILESGAGSMS